MLSSSTALLLGWSIIAILEVCGAGFATNFTEEESEEAESQAEYETKSQQSEVTKASAKQAERQEEIAELRGGTFVQQPAAPEQHSLAGEGRGIVGILEDCEAHFATHFAEEESEEADAQAKYETKLQQKEVKKAKEQDVKLGIFLGQQHEVKRGRCPGGVRQSEHGKLTELETVQTLLTDLLFLQPSWYQIHRRELDMDAAVLEVSGSFFDDEGKAASSSVHGSRPEEPMNMKEPRFKYVD